MSINGRSLDTIFSKQTLPESVYVVVYIPAYIENFIAMNLILHLRKILNYLKFLEFYCFITKLF